jgi:hypothetical protein
LENLRYYSFCYNSETPESEYQLIMTKNMLSNGEILVPKNEFLFGQLFAFLLSGRQRGSKDAQLFDQQACLDYHFGACRLPKKDFINYTKMMYLAFIDNVKITRVKEVIDKRVTDWLDHKEQHLKKAPSFNTYLMGAVAWGDILWEYNMGKNYQHKQDLTAVFWNAFVYVEQKFEAYYQQYKIIDYDTLNDLIYKFRQKFTIGDRVAGVNYYDDLLLQMIDKFENFNQKNTTAMTMTTSEKLDKILFFLQANKSRYNVAFATVQQDVFKNELESHEVRALFKHVIDSGKVRVVNGHYIGWNVDTESFLEAGGFTDKQKQAVSADVVTKKPDLFLSYCWANMELADDIFNELKATGLKCRKDSHELDYKDNIPKFMESIRNADYAILLISDEYLKSKNCMIEFSYLMKEKDHAEKMLPLLAPGTRIFDSKSRLGYTEYWKNEHAVLREHLDKMDIEDALEEGWHLKSIRDISQNISEYLNKLSEMLHLPMEDLKANHYGPLVEKINMFRTSK